MIYEELKIQLDLNNPINVLKAVGRHTKDDNWFVICDDGSCYLFNKNGNEIDIKNIKTLYEELIPKDIKKIIVPNSIIKIEHYTFCTCKNLKSITIPNSIKYIGYYAFAYCENLTSITIPNSVEHIGNLAFYNCKNLKSIVIPNSVKSIEKCAFEWCTNLKSITIPDSVEYIGFRTFFFCKNLKSLTFKGKTIYQVKSMEYYPFGLVDESIIKCIS